MESRTNCYDLRVKAKVIFISLNKVKDMIRNNSPEISDVKLFKMRLTDIQEKIENLRLQSKLNQEILKKEEKILNEDLDYYNQKLPEWSTNVKTKSLKDNVTHTSIKIKYPQKQIDQDICQEVKDFLDFVSISGHDDGWLDRDHQLFLKYRNKYQNIDKVIEKIQAIIPDISEEEIRKHDRWYEKYSELQNKKKEAIKRWHQNAKKNKEEEDESKKVREVKPKKTVRIMKDAEMEEKLKKWKEEKTIKMRKQIENAELLKAITKRKQEQQKEKQGHMKTLVEEWKRRRKINIEIQNLEKQSYEYRNKELKKKEAKKMIKQFRKRDIVYIRRMQNARKKPEPTIEETPKPLKDVPSKLFEPTESWLSRISTKPEEIRTDFQVDNYVKYIPKLHVPAWRKDVPL